MLIEGGRQAEHTYRVTVATLSDRDRQDNAALLSDLSAVFLRGIPMELDGEKRTLHPLGIATEGEKLTFSQIRCVPIPPLAGPADTNAGIMELLHLGV